MKIRAIKMCDTNASFCRLCLNVTDSWQTADLADDKPLCTILKNVFPGMQLELVQTPKICLTCKDKLRFAFSFKNNVLSNEQIIKSTDCFVNTNDMCRLCLKETAGNSVVYMYEKNHCSYSFKLIRTLTEIATAQLDFAIFDKPVMCSDCWSKVKDTYRFKKYCFDNEEKIRNLSKNTNKVPKSLSNEEVLTTIILKEKALTGTNNNENSRTFYAPSAILPAINLDSDDEDIDFQYNKQIQTHSNNNIVLISDSDSDNDQRNSKNKAESSDSESSEEIFDEAFIDDVVEIRIKSPKKNENVKLNTVKIKNYDIPSDVQSSDIRFLDEMKQEMVKQEISVEEHGIYENGCAKFKEESQSSIGKTSLLTPSSGHNVKAETSDQQTLSIAPNPAQKQDESLMINLVDCVRYRSNLNLTNIPREKEETSHLKADLTTNNPLKRIIKCGECDFVTSTKDIMTRHMEKHILYSDTGNKCPNCRTAYRNPDLFEEHIQTCINGSRKHESSERLSIGARNERDATKPHDSTDESQEANILDNSKDTTLETSTNSTIIKSLVYQCSKRSYKSTRVNKYVSHLKNVHDRKFMCDICQKWFYTHGHLKSHLISHCQDRKFTCDVCQKGFKTRSVLFRHKQTHRTDTNFKCSFCHKSFKSNSYLQAHQRRHGTRKEGKYICDICQKYFNKRQYLQQHQKVHSDVRAFVCHVCQRRFKGKSVLMQHLKLHSDDLDYVCHICQKGFKTNAHFYFHKKRHCVGKKTVFVDKKKVVPV